MGPNSLPKNNYIFRHTTVLFQGHYTDPGYTARPDVVAGVVVPVAEHVQIQR